MYQNQPALPKLSMAPNTGEGLSEVCVTVQLIVIPTETSPNPAHLCKRPHNAVCLCCSSYTVLLELGRYLTAARWNWGLKSTAKLSKVLAQLGFHIMISFCTKKKIKGGMELNFSLPKHLIPIILLLLCPKLYLNCISGRFWDVWYRSPAITSDVVSFRTVEPDVKCERCKK